MDLKEQNANSNRHPWELSRADMIVQLLAGSPRHTRYADVGSGDLYFTRRLCDLTDEPVRAIDVNYPTRGPDGQLVICADLDQVPAGSIDCAVLMDVLEHVDDDVGLLRSVDRVLAPAAQLLITVPAHAFLWSEHDVFLGHRRRYSRRLLLDVLRRGGITVVESFYFYALPYAARALSAGLLRLGVRPRQPSGIGRWPYEAEHPITRALRLMLNLDFRISRRLGAIPAFGLGLSICAICRRPSA